MPCCTSSAMPSPWERSVDGEIDAARRLDHMQQHTGQHVLSAAFIRTVNVPTVSFHLGAEVSTIDLAGDVDAAAIARAEDEANRVVFADRDVVVRFVTPEEAPTLPLRKEPARTGHAAARRSAGLRPVSVRRHARVAHRRHRQHRRIRLGAVQGRHARQLRVRRAGRPRVQAAPRCVGGNARACCRCRASELPEAVARLQAEARDPAASGARSRRAAGAVRSGRAPQRARWI